jgi:hypothetical protein
MTDDCAEKLASFDRMIEGMRTPQMAFYRLI